jgi:fluoroquinolone transport system permease protein
MKRLWATILLDTRLLWRNKIYHLSLGLAVVVIWLLRSLFTEEALGLAIPSFFLYAVAGTTYLFLAALVLFGKSERSLQGMVVTPLSLNEYLLSKIIALGFLAVLESLLITTVTYGPNFRVIPFLLGIIILGAFYTLMSFIMVARYNQITELLVPTLLVSTFLSLPLLHHNGVFDSLIFYLWPTQPPLLLMKAAFMPLQTWEYGYALAGSVLMLAGMFRWAQGAFRKFIVLNVGS